MPKKGPTMRSNHPDRELLALCDEWHRRNDEVNALYKEADEFCEQCIAQLPSVPAELFENITIRGNLVASPGGYIPGKKKEPWSRERLQRYLDRPPGDGLLGPTPESRERARQMLASLDAHEAEVSRIWAPYNALMEAQVDAAGKVVWSLYETIAKAEACTLEGLAAQANVLTTARIFEHSECKITDGLILNIARNLQIIAGGDRSKAAA